MTPSFETIFCDDVRKEASGKDILIGVYPADLVPGAVPAIFPISVWMRIFHVPIGVLDFKFQLLAPSTEPIEIAGSFNNSHEDYPILFVFNGLGVHINGYGELVAAIELNGERFVAGVLPIRPQMGEHPGLPSAIPEPD